MRTIQETYAIDVRCKAKALRERNGKLYFLACDRVGSEPEDTLLYEQGAADILYNQTMRK